MKEPGSSISTHLAFDLGASSCRAILGRVQDGRIETNELHRFETPLREIRGHLYWDVEALWHELLETLKTTRLTDPDLRSLSVDSWGVDYVPLGRNGVPVRMPYAYRDARTDGSLAQLTARVSHEDIYRWTGIQFMEINTLCQLWCDRRDEPDLFDETETRLLIADYFHYRFCGRIAAEQTLASTTQLVRAGTRTWARELMQSAGLEGGLWPEIVHAGTVLGATHEDTSLAVVASCSHDTGCAVAAVPVAQEERDWAFLSCGTWSLLGTELDAPLLTDEARSTGFTNEAGLDGTIRFLKNMTGLWMLQECERVWREQGDAVTAETLVDEARRAKAWNEVVDVRDSRFAHRCDMPAVIRTYCAEKGLASPSERGALVRLILESLADGHRRTLREMEAVLGRAIRTLYMVGGGVRNSLLCQLTADRCSCRVVAGPAEATALGNLLIQARTLGGLGGRDIREVVRRSVSLSCYEPGEAQP